MSSRMKALCAIILASLLWSTAGLAKIVVRELNPYTAAFLRFFVASLVILPFFLKLKIHHARVIRDLIPLSLLASLNILCYYMGLTTSTANAATLIYAGVPMLTALLAHFIIRERINKQKILGVLVGFAGILYIAALPIFTHGESTGTISGNIFFILAVISWSLYTIGCRRVITDKGYSPIAVTGVFFFTTAIVFLPISVMTFKPVYLHILSKPSMILLILHLGISVTVATYLLYQWVVKHSSATTASLNNYIGPVFSILVNAAFLKESITPALVIGVAFVLTGVVIASGSGLLQEVKDWVTR